MTLKKYLTHPATLVASGLSLIGIAVKPVIIHAILAVVWQQAGTIFTFASVAAFTLVPRIPGLAVLKPAAYGVAMVAGAVYLTKLGDKIYDEFQERI